MRDEAERERFPLMCVGARLAMLDALDMARLSGYGGFRPPTFWPPL